MADCIFMYLQHSSHLSQMIRSRCFVSLTKNKSAKCVGSKDLIVE